MARSRASTSSPCRRPTGSDRGRSTSTRSGCGPTRPGRPSSGSARRASGSTSRRRFGMEFAPQTNAHLALHVDDVAAARAELEAKGVEFHGETFDTGVCHMAFFSDPDGNALMLHHRYAPREGGRRVVITVERADFVSVPVTDMERSIALLRRDARACRECPRRRAGPSSSSARTSRSTSSTRRTSATSSRRRTPRRSRCACRTWPPARQALEAKGVAFVGETFDTGVCHMALFRRPGRQRADAAPEVRAP